MGFGANLLARARLAFNRPRLLFLAMLLCLIPACSTDDDGKKALPAAKTTVEQAAGDSTGKAANASPSALRPTETKAPENPAMDSKLAEITLQFSNQATRALDTGYYALPHTLHNNTNAYLRNFRLAKKPRVPRKPGTPRNLPEGVFDEREAAALTAALDDMDKALAAMLERYDALGRYVANDEIRDNGKEGQRLGRLIAEGHGQFMKARRTWLEIIEQKAAEAQKALLRGHPLERQILDAEKMFSIFRETAAQAAVETPNRQDMDALRQELEKVLADAKKPPFPASPQLERAYREFLKKVDAYLETLGLALREGFFAPQKKALAASAAACQKTYNEFVTFANQQPVELRPKAGPDTSQGANQAR